MKHAGNVAGVLAALAVGLMVWAHWPVEPLPDGAKADRVIIMKSARKLILFRGTEPLRVYRVSLGRAPVGRKEREGDGRTPEGTYRVIEHKRDSAFHRALRLSYPEMRDIRRAAALGVKPGSDIMIHGIRNGLGLVGRLQRMADWTAGCIAVTDPEIEQIWLAVEDGTTVDIRP